MATGSRAEGGAQVLSAGMRRTIQSIKEIVGNHSDADIYVALKETNMDPNETAQKLLNQDPFLEVKRKRDRKKEPQNVAHKSFVAPEPKRNTELACIPEKNSAYPDPDARRGGYGLNTASSNVPVKNNNNLDPAPRGGYGPKTVSGNIPMKNTSTYPDPARRGGYGSNTTPCNYQGNLDTNARRGGYGPNTESGNVPVKNSTYPVRNSRRGGYVRNTSSGTNQEFRIVRDNRVQNANADSKPDQHPISTSEVVITSGSIKSNSAETSGHQEPAAAQHSSRAFNNPADSQPKQTKVPTTSGGNDKKETLGENPLLDQSTTSRVQIKANSPVPPSSSGSSVVGVYSSNSDPVHVPSLHARPSANVGAIRREVGVVGPRRHSTVSAAKPSSSQTTPLPNTQPGRDGQPRELPRPFNGMSKTDHSSQNIAPESSTHGLHVNKSFSNQYVSRPHGPHQHMGHQKAPQPNKEWKPKASVKPSDSGPGVIGAPGKTVSPPLDKPDVLKKEADPTQDKLSQLNMSETQNVIIAEHIRVSETDRCRLTFGSLGTELDALASSMSMTAEGAEDLYTDPSGSVSISAPESSGDEQVGGSNQLEMLNDSVRSSGSNSPASGDVSDHQLIEKKDSSVSANLADYVDVGLVRDHNSSYTPESLQQRDTSELPSFSSYDPQMGYDMSYFRPSVDETVRGQGLPSSQVLNTHTTNTIPASTIAMVQQQQQQQQQLAQMYPQLHVSHFTNIMPYRQFLSPMYVPPMQVPGYSNSSTYPHPSNGNSYVLMPGNSSHHLTTNGIKYGIQQFKPVPTSGQAVFGNFTSPAGYTINTPGIVTSSGGHDDTSRLKYKDNIYVPNPQAETSEIWMNPRDIPSLQSASYYNMPGQTPHPAYLASHSGHTSFTAAQSSHMQQFPGMYHPHPQPAAIAGPHPMGHAIGGGVGVGVAAPAPGAQVGAYQQPQSGHLNWAGNF